MPLPVSGSKIVDPTVFVFDNSNVDAALPTATTTSTGQAVTKITYPEVQLKHTCNHALATGQFTLQRCPRCLGTGVYYDIQFDNAGQVVPIADESKLGQDLEKIILTEVNVFHPEYAANLKKYIGKESGRTIAQIVRKDIIDAVTQIMNYQKTVTQSTREQISSILSIDVSADVDPSKLIYRVRVLTTSGAVKGVDGFIPLV